MEQSHWSEKSTFIHLCECGSCWRECLWRWPERVRILLRCVCRWQDLWSRNIRTGSTASGGVSVRVMTLQLHLGRRRGHWGGGRSVTPHRALVYCTAKRWWSRVHLWALGWQGRHADTAGNRNRAYCCWGCGQSRRRAWWLADGCKRVTAGYGTGEVVECGGGWSISRDLT